MVSKRPSKGQVRALVTEHVTKQYVRNRSDLDASAELERLHSHLTAAARAYETGPIRQRQAVCDAVMAISDFLAGQGFGAATLEPMNRVVRAIVDLCDQNIADPLFCEKPKKAKGRRSMKDAVRQGQLAAFADAWLASHRSDEGDDAAKLKRAALRMSGAHLGMVDSTALVSARTYQRQTGHHDLIYRSYELMNDALAAEADAVGGGVDGLRLALEVQLDALNAKAEMRET